MLIPMRCPAHTVEFTDDNHVILRMKTPFNEKFMFPLRDCKLLDIEYTSIEAISELIGKQITEKIKEQNWNNLQEIRVIVQEYKGLKC